MLDLGGAKMSGAKPATPTAPAGDLVKDATDASFMVDVVEASRTQPVIVDFWAPWCGPCRQLTPALEKAVAEANGAVRLVKVNLDENPAIAGQLRVQSIPTVYAFVDGQPVDGFQGAQPGESGEGLHRQACLARRRPPIWRSCWRWRRNRSSSATWAVLRRATPRPCRWSLPTLRPSPAWPAAILPAAMWSGRRRWSPWPIRPPKTPTSPPCARRWPWPRRAQRPARPPPWTGSVAADPGRSAARNSIWPALWRLRWGLLRRGRSAPGRHRRGSRLERGAAAKAQLLTVFEAAGPGSDVARAGRRKLSSLLFA